MTKIDAPAPSAGETLTPEVLSMAQAICESADPCEDCIEEAKAAAPAPGETP